MNIDWSERPEGATHYNPLATYLFWYRQHDGEWQFLNEIGEWEGSCAYESTIAGFIPCSEVTQ
jgi:hypothetical protein